ARPSPMVTGPDGSTWAVAAAVRLHHNSARKAVLTFRMVWNPEWGKNASIIMLHPVPFVLRHGRALNHTQCAVAYVRRPTVNNSPPSCPSARIQPSCANQLSGRQLSTAG